LPVDHRTPSRGERWTDSYIKLCAATVRELDEWALENVGAPVTRCGSCQPPRAKIGAAASADPVPGRAMLRPAVLGKSAAGATEVVGPRVGQPVVEAWIGDYIRFERRPAEQEQLRSEIRARLRQLEASRSEVLHATFCGAKHAAADVENLVLYYIHGRLVLRRGALGRALRAGRRGTLRSIGRPLRLRLPVRAGAAHPRLPPPAPGA
jgi:hypothetical protein